MTIDDLFGRETKETHGQRGPGSRVLCCCAGGNSRSHAMAFMLKNYWHVQAIAVGLATGMSRPTLKMLFEWADIIVIMHDELWGHVPSEYDHKKRLCNVGEDTYFMGINQTLGEQCVAWIGERFGEPVPDHAEHVRGTWGEVNA